jgi:hypothetical protein
VYVCDSRSKSANEGESVCVKGEKIPTAVLEESSSSFSTEESSPLTNSET